MCRENELISLIMVYEGLFSKIVAGQRCVSDCYRCVIMAGCENLGSQILTGGHNSGEW